MDVGTIAKYEGCGAMQYDSLNNSLTHCLGRLNYAQVARSKCQCVPFSGMIS